MVINSNISAQIAANNLNTSEASLSASLQRLSSGSKLTGPEADPGAMEMSTQFDAQIGRLTAAQSNVSNALSFAQTQDGYLSQISTALNQMSQLAIQAQDPTKSASDRGTYGTQFSQLANFVNEAATKNFNGVSLFSGGALAVTVDSDGSTLTMAGVSLSSSVYSTATASNVNTAGAAATALTNVEAAINQLSSDRATVGASETGLTYAASQLSVTSENISAADSAIKDDDVATESTKYASANILMQASTAMLAQANQIPQTVLKLLQ
jgi:flagellin